MHPIRILTILVLGTLSLAAATVQIDYPEFVGSPLGKAIVKPIATGDEALDRRVVKTLTRVLVTWDGRKCPPTVRYLGIPALEVMAAMPAEQARIASPFGPAVASLKEKRYVLAASALNELVVATEKRMPELELDPWPAASPHPMVIDAKPDDFKLGKAADWLTGLQLVWRADHRVALTGQSDSSENATNVKSYVNRRLPYLHLAATLGVDDAEFPSRLLDDKKMERYGSRTAVTLDLRNRDTRKEGMKQLAKLIKRQMRKYRKH